MKVLAFLPSAEQIQLVQGVESQLLRRRRVGALGGLIAVAVAALQVITALFKEDYLEGFGRFFSYLARGRFDLLFGPEGLSIYELTGALVLFAGVGTYFLYRWTGFLMRETEEPFRYTFWIQPFAEIAGTPGERFRLHQADQIKLLHYDLMERLNERIRRLSLLDVDSLDPGLQESLTAHIHIEGDYTVREERNGRWVVQVLPRVRIGPPSRPEALADPVNFSLSPQKIKQNGGAGGQEIYEDTLHAGRYKQIVERVYSTIATEVYRQILADVRSKSAYFPTDYLRAVALFHEAEDFERSNTIDAYDYAIELYREANRYFRVRLTGGLDRLLSRLPILWRLTARSEILEARARIGLSRSLVYRRVIAALSGRSQNTLFEAPQQLELAIRSLTRLHGHLVKKPWKMEASYPCQDTEGEVEQQESEIRFRSLLAYLTFPKDTPLRRKIVLFEQQRSTLFEAYTVAALAYAYLGALQKATCFRDSAKAVAPDLSQRNALWLLARAEIEPEMEQKLRLLRLAVEIEPDFEIAQYRLAYYSEMQLRMRDEVRPERVDSVVQEYERVLDINPGNIGALAAQGYLFWLLGRLDEARDKFEAGLEVKAFVRQTFVGDLYYGLGRIAAETCRFNHCHHLFEQALSADPSVGIYTAGASEQAVTSAFEFISADMLRRYRAYKEAAVELLRRYSAGPGQPCEEGSRISSRTLSSVQAFVLNDYGNACLNYFHRFGEMDTLEDSIRAFEDALSSSPNFAVACYNLASAYVWRFQPEVEKIMATLQRAEELAPSWTLALIVSVQTQIRQIQELINQKEAEKKNEQDRIAQAEIEQEKEKEREKKTQAFEGVQFVGTRGRQREFWPEYGGSEVQAAREREWKLEKLTVDIQGARQRLQKLEAEIRELQNSLKSEVFPKISRIMDQTQLTSLLRNLKIDYDGGGVDELLRLRIERNLLDDNDVKTLRVWAEFLSHNTAKPAALQASRKLCEQVLNYYPENFDILYILYRVFDRLGDQENRDSYGRKLGAVIENWLAQDPIRFVSLTWAAEFTPEETFLNALQVASKIEPENPLYIELLAGAYLNQGLLELAVESYQAITRLRPRDHRYHHRLGRIYSEQREYRLAVKQFRRAVRLNSRTGAYHYDLAEALWELGDWEAGDRAMARAIELEPQNEVYINRLGNAYFSRGDYRKAIACYQEATRINPRAVVYHLNLIGAWDSIREPGFRIQAVEQAIAAARQAYQVSPQKEEFENRIRQLEKKKWYAEHLGDHLLDRLLLVTPVAVEVALDLIPHIEGPAGGLYEDFSDQINRMRESIQGTMGVRIPGVRFRGNEDPTDLPLGTYLIMINEVPQVMATISEDFRLFPGPAAELAALGVDATAAVNPADGSPAAWVGRQDWEALEQAGSELWEMLEYLVRHLEAVIRAHLVEFLGHQEVMNMLELELPQEFRELRENYTELSFLVAVLQRLLAEGVPVLNLKEIVRTFKRLRREGAAVLPIVQAVRLLPQIRRSLPGNDRGYVYYRLGAQLERTFGGSIHVSQGQAYLSLPPEQSQNILAGVRQAYGSSGSPLALLVRDGSVRPFVRKLVELEFPQIPVVSQEELLAGLDGNLAGEIELEETAETAMEVAVESVS